jgi:hypothetical protein
MDVVNLPTARFECTFGRGCEGICCREGRPLVYPDEVERIGGVLERLLPALRPEARVTIRRRGWLSDRRRDGERVVRNAGGWCVFFQRGCVLHRAGLEEGDAFRYKPAVCSLFPIQRDPAGRWYVRQKGFQGEKWDLFCLDPASTNEPAGQTLEAELALAKKFDEEG